MLMQMAMAKGNAEIVFYLLGGGGFLGMMVMMTMMLMMVVMMMIMELMILFVRNKLINVFFCIDSEYQPYLIPHPGSYCFI